MILIQLDNVTDVWWEANKSRCWREQSAAKSAWNRANTYVSREMFYIEDAIETTGGAIYFDKFTDERTFGRITLSFSEDNLDREKLNTLMDIEIESCGNTFVFDRVEAVVHEEADFNPYADEGRYSSSTYPRITVIYKAK
jgi:hypothetical protein